VVLPSDIQNFPEEVNARGIEGPGIASIDSPGLGSIL
jgi:hypothetical protein